MSVVWGVPLLTVNRDGEGLLHHPDVWVGHCVVVQWSLMLAAIVPLPGEYHHTRKRTLLMVMQRLFVTALFFS